MTTPATETIVVRRAAIIEAAAFLLAASNVSSALVGGQDTPEDQRFMDAGSALMDAAFGPFEAQRDDDPALVEHHARAEELTADWLTELCIEERIEGCLTAARLYREAGTIAVRGK